jgi:protein-tyrosine phosphatase
MFERMLVLCTGNICRSPMAAALLQQALQAKSQPAEVRSAGIGALIGYPAEEPAQTLMRARGLDISSHHAQQVNADLLRWAQMIFVMEQHQREAVLGMEPTSRGKLFLLGHWTQQEIPDPYRQGQAAYERALELIDQAIAAWMDKRL